MYVHTCQDGGQGMARVRALAWSAVNSPYRENKTTCRDLNVYDLAVCDLADHRGEGGPGDLPSMAIKRDTDV